MREELISQGMLDVQPALIVTPAFKKIADQLNEQAIKITEQEKEMFDLILKQRNQLRGEIVLAFVAKFGCNPEEAELIETQTDNGYTWRIEKRRDNDTKQKLLDGLAKLKREMIFSLLAQTTKEEGVLVGRTDMANAVEKLIKEVVV